uniref:DZIP3-like HEPN domain-containing protein n=1 Tax=Magallana gigas TaxID=29159 RepID=A0A8W8HKP6_MAGGI
MSNSKFKLTGENTNLARVAQMILGPCANVLRDVLRKEISPSNLETKVRAYIAKTKKPLINQHQERLVYSKDYLKFDVTLLYFLLRNMCSIQPHSNKWGNNPHPGDRSVSGNIERIRLIRNEYGHNSERSISDIDFKIKYKYIKGIVRELENYLGSSTKYQDEVKELKTCTMDPTQSEKNIKELLDLNEKIKDISGDVEEMRKIALPWNLKVIYEKDVLKWKEDDSFFVETHNFQAMLDKVRQQPFVTFVGVPGSGKTATARHIAILLHEKDGYEILPTRDINNIEMYCDPRNPQVFVIDDVLGVFGFDMKELEKLTNYRDRLNEPTMPKTKVLMTCREVVFKHEAFSGSILSNKKQVVQLHSEENALNDQDKYDLFAKYNLDKDLLSADTLSKISKSFPYLCKLFSRKEELGHYGQQFFISPVPCIMELLDIMKIRNKIHYASLVLLMTNQNSLSEKKINKDDTTYFREMKFQVLKRCKVDPTTCSFYFIDALTEMEGTYTEQSQSEFKFIHDSMLEIIAFNFGRHFPELILQYMDSDYIANYIKPGTYKCRKRKREEDELEQSVNAKENSDTVASEEYVHDLCIKLQESHYHLLADRLFEDIHRGELFNVFENEALKHPLVLQKFLDVMKSKPYSELFTLFLSALKKEVKRGKKSKKKKFHSKCYKLLMNSKWNDEDGDLYTCVRAIYWVIFYGHNQVLQFIIDQIKENTNTVNDLFQTLFNIRSDDFCTTVQGTDCNKRNESDIDENSSGRCDVSEDESWSDLCSEKSVQSFGTEPVFIEKRRLLNLSCYSGDLLTFQTLLPYCDKNVLLSESWGQIYDDYYDDDNYDDDDEEEEEEEEEEEDEEDWNISDPPIVVANENITSSKDYLLIVAC